jgi:vacuolar-type H+-ATPase subunit I/STV1
LQQVDAFLRRLLLLVHITGGHPSRGTELLSLQLFTMFWTNISNSAEWSSSETASLASLTMKIFPISLGLSVNHTNEPSQDGLCF